MTRKEYELVASVIADAMRSAFDLERDAERRGAVVGTVTRLACAFANTFAEEDPFFDRGQFMGAAGWLPGHAQRWDPQLATPSRRGG